MVTIDDFKKLNIIIAQVKDAREHPQADKLYLLTVDTGHKEKQLVAGIRSSYAKEDLIGRKIVVIDNIEPAVIRGEESQGMLLAAQDENGIHILVPDKDAKIGSPVR